jgi:hypothetical protein
VMVYVRQEMDSKAKLGVQNRLQDYNSLPCIQEAFIYPIFLCLSSDDSLVRRHSSLVPTSSIQGSDSGICHKF